MNTKVCRDLCNGDDLSPLNNKIGELLIYWSKVERGRAAPPNDDYYLLSMVYFYGVKSH